MMASHNSGGVLQVLMPNFLKKEPVYGVPRTNPTPGSVRWRILCRVNTVLSDAVEFNPAGAPRACLIWLHGLGADGHDFEPLIPELGIVDELAVRVLLPHAPRRPVTLNNGLLMRAWYDVTAPDLSAGEDRQGIMAAEQWLLQMIAREESGGIPAERIVLAGFSQGGAMALHTGLGCTRRLAGILALSSYLPLAAAAAEHVTPEGLATPVMMAHGTQDTVIPLALAARSRDQLQQLGCRLDWHSYPMAHALCPEEIRDVRAWLVRRLASGQVSV